MKCRATPSTGSQHPTLDHCTSSAWNWTSISQTQHVPLSYYPDLVTPTESSLPGFRLVHSLPREELSHWPLIDRAHLLISLPRVPEWPFWRRWVINILHNPSGLVVTGCGSLMVAAHSIRRLAQSPQRHHQNLRSDRCNPTFLNRCWVAAFVLGYVHPSSAWNRPRSDNPHPASVPISRTSVPLNAPECTA